MSRKIKSNVIENYEAISDWFDSHRSKDLMEREYLEKVLSLLPKNASILDLGCGTGEPIADFFIKEGISVTGIDGSVKMIQYCKNRFPSMEWIIGDMRDLSLDRKYDAIIAWNSVFLHLNQDEQRTMFPQIRNYIKSGGLLLFTSGSKDEELYGTMNDREFYHASLSIIEYKKLLVENGFNLLLNKVEDPDCGDQTVWLAQLRRTRDKKVP